MGVLTTGVRGASGVGGAGRVAMVMIVFSADRCCMEAAMFLLCTGD